MSRFEELVRLYAEASHDKVEWEFDPGETRLHVWGKAILVMVAALESLAKSNDERVADVAHSALVDSGWQEPMPYSVGVRAEEK